MKTLAEVVHKATGTSPLDCYQCGRCSAGCPQNVPEGMEQGPTHIMRLIQMEAAFADQPELAQEYRERVLSSDTIWVCAGCLACSQRCPQDIDIQGCMDALKEIALEEGLTSPKQRVHDIINLHKSFLSGIRRAGRTNEVGLVAEYKLRSFNLFADVTLAPTMFLKGKLDLNVLKSHAGIDKVVKAAQELKSTERQDNK